MADTTVPIEKAKLVEDIFTLMKPNAYMQYHPLWASARVGLMRLSYKQLGDLYALILCMEKRGGADRKE